jgi:hypothetical protein
MLNEPESTIGIKYESTLDGRNAASHERSSNAGSGDPKKIAEAVKVKPSIGGPGDKLEVHTSEEELGVTTPLPEDQK